MIWISADVKKARSKKLSGYGTLPNYNKKVEKPPATPSIGNGLKWQVSKFHNTQTNWQRCIIAKTLQASFYPMLQVSTVNIAHISKKKQQI